MRDCIFCQIRDGKLGAKVVYQDDDVLAFEDINPQAPTHVVIIPRKHIATLNDLTPGDAELMGRLHLVARGIAADRGHAEPGYRVVMNCNREAGQSVFHIHLHLLAGRRLRWPPG
jgi:histidine triad (HIT) family protein